MKVTKRAVGVGLVTLAFTLALGLLRPDLGGPQAEADFHTPGGISALPSAIPALPGGTDQVLPAIIPASGPGNEALITVFLDRNVGCDVDGDGIVTPYPFDPPVFDVIGDNNCNGAAQVTFEVTSLVLATSA